jgi:hypothetical protein
LIHWDDLASPNPASELVSGEARFEELRSGENAMMRRAHLR